MHRYRFQIGSTDALERKLDEVTLLTCPLLLSRTFMHRYHFQIGSTDALERKLDEAQRDLELPPERHVPVK